MQQALFIAIILWLTLRVLFLQNALITNKQPTHAVVRSNGVVLYDSSEVGQEVGSPVLYSVKGTKSVRITNAAGKLVVELLGE